MRKCLLILLFIAATASNLLFADSIATWDFGNPGNYAYDASRIKVASGNASLVQTANWWSAQWPYRKRITINNMSGSDQPDMFVRISLTSAQTDFWAHTTGNGFDVRFVDSGGAILLFNRASWNSASQSATFYVKFANLPSGLNTIYMYYGNQGAPDGSTTLSTLVGSGGVETTYTGPMEYLAVNLGTNLFITGGSFMQFPGTQNGDESNLLVPLTNFADGFPYFGGRYTSVKIGANGCVHPYTTNPIQMGDANPDGETTPNGPCSRGSVNDPFSIPRRLIYPHFSDKIHLPLPPGNGLYITYVAGTPSEYRFRWQSRAYGNGPPLYGGLINMMVRLKSNGNIQFDYGAIPNGDPGRVGISPGTGAPGLLVSGYDAANVSNAASVEFRAYKVLSGTPTIGARETQYPATSPTISNVVASPFTSLLSFSHNAITPAGTEIRYILSTDATDPANCSTAFTWLYWNGTAWVPSNQSVVQSSSVAEITANLASFPRLGNFCWRAFLRSDGTATPVLDHLTVGLSEAQPDALVAYVPGAGGPVFIGNNTFNSDGQDQSIAVQASTPQTFLIRVQNDGLFADSFRLVAHPVSAGWSAQYFDAETGGNPIPEAVITTVGYTTPILSVGGTFTIRAVYTASVNATPGVPMNILVTASSTMEPAIVDAVGMTLTPVFARPDLLIGTDPSLLIGAGDYTSKDFDFVEFYICVEGAHNCNNPEEGALIATFTGNAFGWRLSQYSLQAFTNQSVRLKFRFRSNTTTTGAGFYLDDIAVRRSESGPAVFTESFESGTAEWFFVNVGGNGDNWHTVTCDANSPNNSLFAGEGACASYVNQKDILAITSLPINLAGASSPFIEFWRKFAFPSETGQILSLSGAETLSYYVRLRNNGNAVGNFNLRAQGPRQGDRWAASFVQLPYGPNLTANIQAAGHIFQLAPAEEVTLRVTMSLFPELNGGEVISVPLYGDDTRSPFGQDEVLAAITVESAFQPDSLIADNPAGPFIGDDQYDPTQFVEHLAGPDITRRFYITLQNDGNIRDDLRIKGTVALIQGNAQWDVKYFDAFTGGNDITSAVTSPAGFVFPGLLRGNTVQVRVEVTPSAPAGGNLQFNSSLELLLTTESVSNPTATDVARLRTRVAYIVDAEAGQTQNCSNMTGLGVINTTGANQLSVLASSPQAPAVFCVKIHNIGFRTGLRVSGAIDTTGAWDIRYFLPGPSNSLIEVTGIFASGGYSSPELDTNENQMLYVQMTPSAVLPDGASHEIAITGASTAFTGVVDVVRLRATVVTVIPSTYDVDLVIDGKGSGIRSQINTGDGGRTQKSLVEGTINFHIPLILRNEGNTSDNITLSLSANPPLPANWVILLFDGVQARTFPTSVSVPAASQQLYSLILNVPLGGTSRSIFVNAVSGGNPNAVDSVAVDLTVVPRQFLVDGVIDGKGQDVTGTLGTGAGGVSTRNVILLPQPFTPVDFAVDIFNKGNVADAFSVSWSTPTGWVANLVDGTNLLSSPVITPSVQPGQAKSYIFRVQVPANATSITPFYLDIQSQSSPVVVDSLLAGVNPTTQPSTQLTVARGLAIQNRTVSAGAVRVPILQITATASQLGNPVRLRGFTLRASGEGDDSRSVRRVQLWRDNDNNGAPDSPLPLAEGVYFADDGPVFLDIAQVEVLEPTQSRRYLITYDFGSLTASAEPAKPRSPFLPVSYLLASLAVIGLGVRSGRAWLLGLLLMATLPLVLVSCNGGGGTVVQAAATFRATIDTPSQVTALDHTTSLPAAVVLANPPITSAEVTLQ
ncbi:MAG: DUF2341 domain-containing protein [bacterium JZ-2024 1]